MKTYKILAGLFPALTVAMAEAIIRPHLTAATSLLLDLTLEKSSALLRARNCFFQ